MEKSIITITCLGDIAPVNTSMNYILDDFRQAKKDFGNLCLKSDIVFGNLEAPFTIKKTIRENKKYTYKTEPKVLGFFPVNFIFSIANNHILAYCNEGLLFFRVLIFKVFY